MPVRPLRGPALEPRAFSAGKPLTSAERLPTMLRVLRAGRFGAPRRKAVVMPALWRTLPRTVVFCLSLLLVAFQPAMSRAGDGEDEEDQQPRKTAPGPSEREQRILSLFSATSRRFEDGRIILVYDFLKQEDAVAADWAPAVDRTWKSRIHWTSQGEADQLQEGSSSGFYSSSRKSAAEG